MIEACGQASVPLYVAYYRRRLPQFVAIRSRLLDGSIGDIRSVQIEMYQSRDPAVVTQAGRNWRVNPDIAGGGYFYDLAPHQLDLLDYALGAIVEATGFVSNQAMAYAAEDTVSAAFRFESGVLGSGNWCFSTSPSSTLDRTRIIGTRGEVSFETFGEGAFTLTTQTDGERIFQFDQPRHAQQPLIQTVIDDLLGKGACPSTGESAARTNRDMDEIFCQASRRQ